MPICPRCKNDFGGFLGNLTVGLNQPCPACEQVIARENQAYRADLHKRAKSVILTTTHSVEGHPIDEYLGIESVEIVMGTGAFTEFGGSVADFFGQRSKGFEAKLAQAKQAACQLLQLKAAEKGANAVVGVDMDFTEFSGNRVGVILNGTLVKVLEPY